MKIAIDNSSTADNFKKIKNIHEMILGISASDIYYHFNLVPKVSGRENIGPVFIDSSTGVFLIQDGFLDQIVPSSETEDKFLDAIDFDSSSTNSPFVEDELDLVRLFLIAEMGNWEEGEFGDFSKKLISYINNSPNKRSALEELEDALKDKSIPDEIKSEAYSAIGELSFREINPFLRYLLITGLNSSSSTIKFGAISGIASLKDKGLVRDLEQNLLKEEDGIVREFISSAIEYLKKR